MHEASLDLDAGLRELGYDRFRPGQREAIETLLAERRLLLVAPTGGGKSLRLVHGVGGDGQTDSNGGLNGSGGSSYAVPQGWSAPGGSGNSGGHARRLSARHPGIPCRGTGTDGDRLRGVWRPLTRVLAPC